MGPAQARRPALFCLTSFCFLLAALPYATAEGFLADEIPLEIISVTPSTLLDGSVTSVQQRQTITAVFSRPVIALGADFGEEDLSADFEPFTLAPRVPGRLRWVTTYIARFDSEEDWPRDLHIKLTWNKNLMTYDGVKLQLPGRPTTRLETPSNNVFIANIVSQTADNLTANNWSPFIGLDSDILPERVYDGVIELRFEAPVNLTVLQQSLKVRRYVTLDDPSEKEETLLRTFVKTCDPVRKTQDAKESTYDIYMEAGVQYSAHHGALKKEMSVSFGGIRPFKLPFRGDAPSLILNTKYFDVWLPHGTGVEQTIFDIPINITDRKTNEEVAFTREEISPSIMRLMADVHPGGKYKIETFNSTKARDGYGQELVATSFNFMLRITPNVFRPMSSNYWRTIMFESGQDWGSEFALFTKGRQDEKRCDRLEFWSVKDARDAAVLSLYDFEWRYDKSVAELLGRPSLTAVPSYDDPLGSTDVYDVAALIDASGILAVQQCLQESEEAYFSFLMETHMLVSVLTFATRKIGPSALVFATDMQTGEPMVGVHVSLYAKSKGTLNVRQLGRRVQTDSSGRAELVLDEDAFSAIAVVEDGSRLTVVQDVDVYHIQGDKILDFLALDRKLLQPNETLYVKGYVRETSGTELVIPSELGFTLEVRPSLDDSSDKTLMPLNVSEEYGSFEAGLKIPVNATLRSYTITLRREDEHSQGYYGVSERFIVGVPRTPTVQLDVVAPKWISPTGKVNVSVIATSFVGGSVGDQDILVEWHLSYFINEEYQAFARNATIVTDAAGRAAFTLDLSDLEHVPPVHETIYFTVRWVGPTGELIEEEASTELAWADLRMDIRRTVSTDIPQQTFGVWVELSDLAGDELSIAVYNASQISLKQVADDAFHDETARGPLDAAVVETCEYRFGQSELCSFKLPFMNIFVLEACIDLESFALCRRISIGHLEQDWIRRPLRSFLPLGIYTVDRDVYKAGDAYEIFFDNPYEKVHAMIVWGNTEGTHSRVESLPDNQISSVIIELNETCQFGCSFAAVVAVPRQTAGLATTLDVPVSKLHDPAMPHVEFWESTIRVESSEEEDIQIHFDFPDAVEADGNVILPPGSSTHLELVLDRNEPTEVTVIIVDKAILELVSNQLPRTSDFFKISATLDFDMQTTGGVVVSPGAIQALIEDLASKKEVHPWFEVNYDLYRESYYSTENIDLLMDTYIDRVAQYITVHPEPDDAEDDDYVSLVGLYYANFYNEDTQEEGFADLDEYSVDLPVAKLSAVSTESAPAAPPVVTGDVRFESEFKANVLFRTEIARKGKLSIDIETPANLGTFVVRAFAATADSAFGNAETEIVVKRDISITPSVPRFVRVGDSFYAGVVVTVTGSPKDSISVSVTADGPVDVMGRREIKVNDGADKQETARFRFQAQKLGSANLTFAASDKHGNRDAVQISFPIEGLQESVIVGTSFVLSASEARSDTSEDGLVLPKAVPGSGTIVLTAGVGQQPAVLSLVEQLLSRNPTVMCPLTSGFVLGATLIPAIINPYSPWSTEPNEVTLTEAIVNASIAAAKQISIGKSRMTRRGLGLINYLSCPEHISRYSPVATLQNNAKALWLFNQVREHYQDHEVRAVRQRIPDLDAARQEWHSALEQLCVKVAKDSRERSGNPLDLHAVALCRAALGASWEAGSDSTEPIKEDLSMNRLGDEFDKAGLEGQAFYILALQEETPEHPDVAKAIREWSDLYRVAGRTAYISAHEGAATPASLLANSLILMVMTRAGESGQLLPKLANYVASPVRDDYGFGYVGDYDMSVAMTALVAYDAARNNTQPNIDFAALSGDITLLETTFDEDSPPIARSTTDWDSLDEEPAPIGFSVQGSGEVSAAVTLRFVPSELLPFPSYRGIFVQRSIQLQETAENGLSLAAVSQGTVVFVKVQFMTPDSLQETIVRVLMPAGLEPVDPNILGGVSQCPVPFFGFLSFYYPFLCPLQETRPDVVSFEFDSVSAGTHTVAFRAVAVTRGRFTLPPTRVFVRDQPEVTGLSSAGSFEVCGEDCDPVFETETSVTKSCPADCNDNGACNVEDGTCRCFRGFGGEACEQTAS